MALEKLKQVFEDANLKDAPKAEHGIPKFAHVNVLVDYINALETRLAAREAVPVIPSYADSTAANAALNAGDVYYDEALTAFRSASA